MTMDIGYHMRNLNGNLFITHMKQRGGVAISIFKSIKGLFGQTIHYKDGEKVGETWDGFIPGAKNHYGANGSFVGSSAPGFFADEVHYDQHGGRIGESWTDAFGTTRHYDSNGRVGTSYDGVCGVTSDIMDGANTLFDQSDYDRDPFADDVSWDDSDW